MIKYILIAIACIVVIIIGIHQLKPKEKEYDEDYDIESLESLVSTNEAQRLMGWTTEEFYRQRKEMYLRELDAKEKRQR